MEGKSRQDRRQRPDYAQQHKERQAEWRLDAAIIDTGTALSAN
jgi:hypothetical protein